MTISGLPRDDAWIKPRSIRVILAVLVLAVLTPVLAFSAYVIHEYTQRERVRALNQAAAYAEQVQIDVDRNFRSTMGTLSGLASSPALQTGDFETFYRQAESVARMIETPIVLRDLTGQHLVNTRVPWGSVLPRVYQPAVDDIIKIKPQPFVSDLFTGTLAKKPIINVVTPVFVKGALSSTLSTSVEAEALSRILTSQALPANWVVSISDRVNNIVARSADLDKFIGQPSHWPSPVGSDRGAVRLKSPDGIDHLKGYARTQEGWTVSAFISVAAVEQPLRQAWNIFLMSGLVALGSALAMARLIGARIARPLVEVARRAKSLTRIETIPPISSPVSEINEVSLAISNASIELRARERDVLESESRYRALFEQAAVGFEHVTLDGEWLGINGQLRKMLGYARDEVIDILPADLTPEEDRTAEEGLIEQLVRGNIPSYAIDKRYRKKDGSMIWVRATSSLAREHNGTPAYRISVIEDVTERRRTRAESARLAALVQSSHDAIVSMSLNGIIETWNPGAERLFGRSASTVIGHHHNRLFAAKEHALLANILKQVAAGEAVREELCGLHQDGSLLDVGISAAPILTRKGKIIAVSHMIEDIRERKEWERRLAILNRELQHRVRNTLAVVQSISNQTMNDNPSREAFRLAFQGRLQSLASASEMLTKSNWNGADLADFIELQLLSLVPRRKSQLTLKGQRLNLPASLAVPIGLCIHELGTNALKHGAWTQEQGRVDIQWRVTSIDGLKRPELNITWREHGGPPVTAPTRQGFGTVLVERGIPGARVVRAFSESGFNCTIDVELPTS
jgi:PAS domain S-box-containing protein